MDTLGRNYMVIASGSKGSKGKKVFFHYLHKSLEEIELPVED